MRKYICFVVLGLSTMLAACGPTPVPINQAVTEQPQQAIAQQDTTLRDAALGGVAGFLLGRATSGGGSHPPPVVHNTTVVKKTIIQQNVVRPRIISRPSIRRK
jgi:hypothetical protein